ncbi:MAG: hypothetical protein C0594_16800 [Marinilabiliales bacterium]|nr:MAG: hypothetical protein C0594_16800 [Marinilabiliales bacterium]
MKTIPFIYLILLSLAISAQTHTLSIQINEYGKNKLLLASYYGEKNFITDTAETNDSGFASFNLNETYLPGMYKIILTDNSWLTVIYNKEDIRLSTHASFPNDSLQVIESSENLIYKTFQSMDEIFRLQLDLITPVVNYYPIEDEYYQTSCSKYTQLQKEREMLISEIIDNNPDLYASKLIALQKTPEIKAEWTEEEKLSFLKNNYFENLDLTDTSLLRTNAYNNIIIKYLSLYSNPELTQQDLENEFIKAVKIIMKKCNQNPEVYDFIIDYLMAGFEKFQFNKVIDFIASNYREDNSCDGENGKSTLQKRIDNYTKLAVGMAAPDFSITDDRGSTLKLSDFNNDKIVLVFWASWCPHCKELIPEIKKMYDEKGEKNWEVIAISLDNDKEAWMQYITENDLDWFNASELLGWESEIADLYSIYATPTIFILDKNKNILAKPLTINGIINAL